MEDRQLLQEFVRQGSQRAFSQLVERHKDWLYSACLRRLRDPSLAEDATQAVFVALARKAPKLLNVTALSPWLHQTAKYAAANIERTRARRTHHESEAAAMIRAQSQPEPQSNWEQIAAELEPALDRLRLHDRQTILLRFYEQKTHEQIAAILDISENAAKKRLSRAIDRLRSVLSKRGVVVTASCLTGLLLTNVSSAAPITLAASVSAMVGSPSSGQLTIFAKNLVGWFTAAKLQTTAVVAVFALVVPAPWLIFQGQSDSSAQVQTPAAAPQPPAVEVAPSSEPAQVGLPSILRLANAAFREYAPVNTKLTTGIDPRVIRVPGNAAAGYVNSSAPLKTAVGRGAVVKALTFRGRRIRISGWIKSKDLENWAGLQVLVAGADEKFYAAIHYPQKAITGTTDWTNYSQVVDVPTAAENLYVATTVWGKGELWSDDVMIEPVPTSIPITDDQTWRVWGYTAPRYSTTVDLQTLRDDRPTMRIESKEIATHNDWTAYDRYDRSIEKFRGHKVRFTAWIKSEDVENNAGTWIRILGPSDRYIAGEVAPARRPIRGTTDWTKYTLEVPVPREAMAIGTGFVMDGMGKIWIDLETTQVELIE